MTEKVEDLESPPAYQQPPPPTYQNPPPTYQNPPPAHPQTAFVSTQPVGYGGYGQPGMVAVSGPGGGTTVVVQQTAVRPASYLALSILVCIFCNLIFGESSVPTRKCLWTKSLSMVALEMSLFWRLETAVTSYFGSRPNAIFSVAMIVGHTAIWYINITPIQWRRWSEIFFKVGHYKKTKVVSFSWKSPEIFQKVHWFHPCKANGGLPCLVLRYFSTI